MWVVVGGFVVSLVLLWHVVSNAVKTLPEDIQARLRGSVRSNARPLIVSAVVITWTLSYLLYSVAVVPINTADDAAEGNVALSAGGASATDDSASLDPATDAATSGPGTTVVGAARSASKAAPNTTALSGVSLGAPAANIKEPNLYSGASNTLGITNNLIKVCGHGRCLWAPCSTPSPRICWCSGTG